VFHPNLHFCMCFHQRRTQHDVGLVQTLIKATGGFSDVFLYFLVVSNRITRVFLGVVCFWFWNKNIFSTCNKFLFLVEISFGNSFQIGETRAVHRTLA